MLTVHENHSCADLNGMREKGTDAARIWIKYIATFIQETKWRRWRKLNQQEPSTTLQTTCAKAG